MLVVLLTAPCFASQPAPAEPVAAEPMAEEPADAGSMVAEPPAPASAYPIQYPGQCTPDTPHFDLEEHYHHGTHAEGLALAEARFAASPDPEVAWHAARFIFEIGEGFERDDPSIDKEAHYEKMADYSEKGLELSPGHPHLLFARGIARGRLGTTRGVLASLFLAKDVERDWLAAAGSGAVYSSIGGQEKMPCDIYQALAIYYRLVPEWWIVQVLAGTRGDLDTSLEFAQKADACAPDTIRHLKELAVTQMCIGTKRKQPELVEAGRANVRAYLALTPRSKTEKIDMKHGRMLLDDPSIACGYSRDGQQDLDRDKLPQQ